MFSTLTRSLYIKFKRNAHCTVMQSIFIRYLSCLAISCPALSCTAFSVNPCIFAVHVKCKFHFVVCSKSAKFIPNHYRIIYPSGVFTSKTLKLWHPSKTAPTALRVLISHTPLTPTPVECMWFSRGYCSSLNYNSSENSQSTWKVQVGFGTALPNLFFLVVTLWTLLT